jgi:hypothetical protein
MRCLALTLLVAISFAGCASDDRLTLDNYDRVVTGMTPAEVRDILGQPDDDEGGGISVVGVDLSGRVMVWEEGERLIEVTFAQGEVVQKFQKGLD